MNAFGYTPAVTGKAFELDGYYVWDCSVIAAKGKYYLFSSRWKQELGFGWNWLFSSEIIQSVADHPEGPYRFLRVVLPQRDRCFFDGCNTHNTCIKEYNGKYYLYYMGTTYGGEHPGASVSEEQALEVWNGKRIGVAVADDIEGEFVRRDTPLLEPRDCSHWDCTITTNPSVAILPDGKTYMIYKSRTSCRHAMQLGVAAADCPDGAFVRLTEHPILDFHHIDLCVEDPFLWYDAVRRRFCMIAKDDSRNGAKGLTGEWGSGFYAESEDCVSFELPDNPTVYTRDVIFEDGHQSKQANLERPSVLFNEAGEPEYLFFASGKGKKPYAFEGRTYILCTRLVKK